MERMRRIPETMWYRRILLDMSRGLDDVVGLRNQSVVETKSVVAKSRINNGGLKKTEKGSELAK